jgi:hypothetical protein
MPRGNSSHAHQSKWLRFAAAVLLGGGGLSGALVWAADSGEKIDTKKNRVYPQWEIHDEKRPRPPVITPPEPSTQEKPGTPPSDAVVLFDGKDLSKWSAGGKDAPWKLQDGAMVADKASIETREPLGDVQLHLEWTPPSPANEKQHSQERGNSGVLLFGGQYEVQVLDSYHNETYADGQAGAVYGQNPPMVNPIRPPGQWNTYDILWRTPKFDADGKLLEPAHVTVMFNCVYVQDCFHPVGPTGHHFQGVYTKGPDKAPLQLQYHGNPTKFRNIWYRPLPPEGVASMSEVSNARATADHDHAEKAANK